MPSLADLAVGVLTTADAAAKAAASRAAAAAWRSGAVTGVGSLRPPDRPSRPPRPELRRPAEMPKRSTGALPGRIALLHAVAHIELNAIDLAWDLLARFADDDMPRAFIDDWVGVGDDEARHFRLLSDRLSALGAAYGDLPAHDGLWQSATATAGDLAARLAVVPMVLEARGLDVTPAMIERLTKVGDHDSAAILKIIYAEEIGHVAAGQRWFEWICERQNLEPETTWKGLVNQYFANNLKPPFNHDARNKAGMSRNYYENFGKKK